jgi:16S rRNA (guanine966-N2)-methyltransferase
VRIVGGSLRGRRLATPATNAIRPTSDRTRESLFNILSHRVDLAGLRAIDLFAGTGALGLEAISRGASHVLFVETGFEGRGLIRSNIETLNLGGTTRIFKRDATSLGEIGNMEPFDLALLDPPYGKGLGKAAIGSLIAGHWLKPQALIVLEERVDCLPREMAGCTITDIREYGDTAVAFITYDGY